MSPIQTDRLDLVVLTLDITDDLLAGRRNEAGELGGFVVQDDWPDSHDARFLRLRQEQMVRDPAVENWLIRAMVLRGQPDRPMIGHVGFHGPPDEGSVEMGYTVFPAHRGHGYAAEAVEGLMGWARTHDVMRFVLSIAPANAPSLAVARKLAFKRIGRHIDDEDGLEYIFELKA
jgi:ribosomal-protein-alanine N-acetyltransferase